MKIKLIVLQGHNKDNGEFDDMRNKEDSVLSVTLFGAWCVDVTKYFLACVISIILTRPTQPHFEHRIYTFLKYSKLMKSLSIKNSIWEL